MIQIRGQEKKSLKLLSDLDINNLNEKDFRVMIVKMIQDLRNKLEPKTDKLQETMR